MKLRYVLLMASMAAPTTPCNILRTLISRCSKHASRTLGFIGAYKVSDPKDGEDISHKNDRWIRIRLQQDTAHLEPKDRYARNYKTLVGEEIFVEENWTAEGKTCHLTLPIRAFSRNASPENSSLLDSHPYVRNIEDYYTESGSSKKWSLPRKGGEYLDCYSLNVEFDLNITRCKIQHPNNGRDVVITCPDGTTYTIPKILNMFWENGCYRLLGPDKQSPAVENSAK